MVLSVTECIEELQSLVKKLTTKKVSQQYFSLHLFLYFFILPLSVLPHFPSACPIISPSVSLRPLTSTRPWDPLNDLIQFEKDGCIQTKVRHRTPMVRSGSLISLSNQGPRRDNCKCQVGFPDRKPT